MFTIILLFSIQLSAQQWAPEGAVWHYGYASFNPNVQTFKTITAGSTILVNGTECRLMNEQTFYEGVSQNNIFPMYSENDSVFYYNVEIDGFCLLYDFSVTTGNNIYLECFDMTVHIDSTSIRTINGTERRVQHVSSESLGYSFGGTIIEGIGDTVFMLPQEVNSPNGPLRCYQDSDGFVSFSDLSCDTVISTSLPIVTFNSNWLISPNPANDQLSIEFVNPQEGNCTFNIYSLKGELLQTVNTSQQLGFVSISVANLASGSYIIECPQLKSRTGFVIAR